MKKKINLTIENKLLLAKRDMSVYHHSTRSAHMISHDSAYTFLLKSVTEDDYIHISLVSGAGSLENKSMVDLPSWADYEFSSIDKITISHSGSRTLLKIPPGLPTWQLRITRPTDMGIKKAADKVIIGDS